MRPPPPSPGIRLREVRGEDDLRTFAAVGTAAWPDEPLSAGFLRRQQDTAPPDQPRYYAVAEVDGKVVGTAEAGSAPGAPAGHLLIEVRVAPEHRHRGVGHALYQHLREALAPRRPRALDCRVAEDDEESLGFASRRGFRRTQREARSELDPAAFDPAPWRGLEERLATKGVAVRTLGELQAEDPHWEERLYDLQSAVWPDVPAVDEVIEVPSREQWSTAFRDNPDLLPEGYVVAVEGERYVGVSELWASQATDRLLYTGFTGVRRSHRRRGIAAALKARAAGHATTLRASHGRPPRIRTSNEENNPMLALNLRLGFREIPALLYHRRWLGDTTMTLVVRGRGRAAGGGTQRLLNRR